MDAEEVDQLLRDALETGDEALIAKAVEIAARALLALDEAESDGLDRCAMPWPT